MDSQEELQTTQKEEEPYGLGCALESFAEIEEVNNLINNIKYVIKAERSIEERAYERFNFILSQYTDQPHLIDSHLDSILEKFISIIRDEESSLELKHMTFKYMFIVVNVRGYKVIVRHLPHEVADFEPVLQLLEAQDPADTENWQTRYILLLWLSIIVMIPFHMSRLDGFNESTSETKTVMNRVLDIVKTYAVVSDVCRDAAAYLSSRFITRYDVKEEHLESFFDWTMTSSLSNNHSVFYKHGTLACVALILKHGKREDLLPHARKLLQWIVNPDLKNNTGANVQKLIYKIVQRIGLTFLPPRLASWRYKRGNRSLAANLSAGDSKLQGVIQQNSNSISSDKEDIGEDIDVPDEVEEVIDQLIQGLGNVDRIVRWSAAKGIGRVTGRLPKELADEVVGYVLQLFNPREGDAAWHGGCLALAELGRRGLLLPQRLPEVVPVVLKALVFDEPRGYSSVGSHIRDAACYVCWSFARAYETTDLQPFVNDIASTLLVVTCFDREINCRRAASAAFQENVGRQGSFPHGIIILTTADFFAVSVRNNAYLQISIYIAQFEEYTMPLIEHLVERKADHWDTAIRELTAKALHNLTSLAPEYMINTVLPALFEKAYSIDLNARHGAILAIGEIFNALAILSKAKNEKISSILNAELLEKSKNLIGRFRERMYFRGLGGELMKQAFCDFIEKCSLAALPFHDDPVIDEWLNLINECIPYDVVNVRSVAIKALPVLLNEYFRDPSKSKKREDLIAHYLKQLLLNNTQVVRMGHALAIGSFPKFMLEKNVDTIVGSLLEANVITPPTLKWAESRRDSVKALTSIVTTLRDDIGSELTEKHIENILYIFLEGLNDYTKDKRGDIGAWIREASMIGLQTLTILLTEKKPNCLKATTVVKIIAKVAQQAVEKIDRTRALAGKVFCSFIHSEDRVPHIPHHDQLLLIFPKEESDQLNWNYASATFPKFVQLLKYHEYTYELILGLVCSVGGMTETLVKSSSSSLFDYLKSDAKDIEEIKRLCDVIFLIFTDNLKNDRITVAMFRFLEKLIESGHVDRVMQDATLDYAKKFFKQIQIEISGSRDIYKLIDAINVMCQFVQVKGEVCDTALYQIAIFLCHPQSYVRRCTSTRLYESLLVNGDSSNIKPENLDDVLHILCNTNWEIPVPEIKPLRNDLCNLMGIKVPVPKARK